MFKFLSRKVETWAFLGTLFIFVWFFLGPLMSAANDVSVGVGSLTLFFYAIWGFKISNRFTQTKQEK